MRRFNRRLLILASAAALLAPAAGYADLVFDPANFAEAVAQVVQDVQLVEQLRSQVHNGQALVQGWGFTRLGDLLQSMAVWQEALGQGSGGYATNDPGAQLDQTYPSTPAAFATTSDTSYAALQASWNEAARQNLIEDRTVQNDLYQQLAPTAGRLDQYVQHANAASGPTAVLQASNEEVATLVAQLQGLEAQEVSDARGEVERDAREQAEAAYALAQDEAVRGGGNPPPAPTSSLPDPFPLAE